MNKKISDESNLLSELRWIEDALKKIKGQRNCLQIERLQLESMISGKKVSAQKKNKELITETIIENDIPIMQTETKIVPVTFDKECNVEKLNLDIPAASNYILPDDLAMEEEEDDLDEDEIMLDMNMFMT